jgi:hypothetical protein
MPAQEHLEFGADQELVLVLAPLFSGLVSLAASSWIIVEVFTTRKKLYTVYNRLLLGMSIIDVLTSIAYMFGPLPMPSDYEETPGTLGNEATCTAQGFFVQLGIIPPICKY